MLWLLGRINAGLGGDAIGAWGQRNPGRDMVHVLDEVHLDIDYAPLQAQPQPANLHQLLQHYAAEVLYRIDSVDAVVSHVASSEGVCGDGVESRNASGRRLSVGKAISTDAVCFLEHPNVRAASPASSACMLWPHLRTCWCVRVYVRRCVGVQKGLLPMLSENSKFSSATDARFFKLMSGHWDRLSKVPRGKKQTRAQALLGRPAHDEHGRAAPPATYDTGIRARFLRFTVQHYDGIGAVTYTMAGFMDANRQSMPTGLHDLLNTSSDPVVRDIFGYSSTNASERRGRSPTRNHASRGAGRGSSLPPSESSLRLAGTVKYTALGSGGFAC